MISSAKEIPMIPFLVNTADKQDLENGGYARGAGINTALLFFKKKDDKVYIVTRHDKTPLILGMHTTGGLKCNQKCIFEIEAAFNKTFPTLSSLMHSMKTNKKWPLYSGKVVNEPTCGIFARRLLDSSNGNTMFIDSTANNKVPVNFDEEFLSKCSSTNLKTMTPQSTIKTAFVYLPITSNIEMQELQKYASTDIFTLGSDAKMMELGAVLRVPKIGYTPFTEINVGNKHKDICKAILSAYNVAKSLQIAMMGFAGLMLAGVTYVGYQLASGGKKNKYRSIMAASLDTYKSINDNYEDKRRVRRSRREDEHQIDSVINEQSNETRQADLNSAVETNLITRVVSSDMMDEDVPKSARSRQYARDHRASVRRL
jgi:hypothetical protein